MLDSRLTEQRNPRSVRMDRMTPLELVRLMGDENRRAVEAVDAEAASIARAVELVEVAFGRGGRLFYVGAGSSGRLGVLDAAEMPPTFGTDPEQVQGLIAGGPEALVRAREGAEDDPAEGARALEARGVGPTDFVLGIAASGTTPFVHGALARARELGASTGFLLCTPPPEALVATHDVVIAPLTGPEVVTGSTRLKAGTATKLVLNAITTAAMVRTGKVWGHLMVDLQVTCKKLHDRGIRMLRATTDVSAEEAARLLQRADGEVRTALVMARLGIEAPKARRRLEEAGGKMYDVVGPPPPMPSAGTMPPQGEASP